MYSPLRASRRFRMQGRATTAYSLILPGALTTQMASYGRFHIEAILHRAPKPPAPNEHHAPQKPYPAHRR